MEKKGKKPAREFAVEGFVGAGLAEGRRAGRKAWLFFLSLCPRGPQLAAEVWISEGLPSPVLMWLVKKLYA